MGTMEGKKIVISSKSAEIQRAMEGKKPITSSPESSSAGSISSSTGVFSNIFPRVGKDSSQSELLGPWRKQDQNVQAWNPNYAPGDGTSQSSDSNSKSIPYKDRSSVFQDDTVQPCFFSSSIYYGGQDIYSRSPTTQDSRLPYDLKKDSGEDDSNLESSNIASRGNWWQGSLYY
ncbi:uncharacterized protein LOC143856484 isoform X2 [Tasmannia lanceolata]|uniref:uncharacterized protein LOC143856484 isoform X2 n=1 Tax=Tasmannia lanceolata TaxID=3420 RepID=UPI004063A85C